MANFKVVPLEVISAPNYYSVLKNNRWDITNPNQQVLWFQLQIIDNLGARHYIPATGSTLEATFMRADKLTAGPRASQLTYTAQSVVKSCVANASDKSLYSISMTSQDVQNIVSGSVKFRLVESGIETVWLFDWGVSKKLTDAGF